jgi:hypothetical protein
MPDQNIYSVLAQESHFRFEVLVAKILVFCDVTPWNLADHYQHFRRTAASVSYPEDGGSNFF